MLARSTILKHPSGVTLETPLLVPSFSSKGFKFRNVKNGKQVSEVVRWMRTSSEVLTETMLVSAYDIFYEHIPSPVKSEFVPQMAFLDSGGYEVSEAHDDSAVFKFPSSMHQWSESKLIRVIDAWTERIPLVVINYDYGAIAVKKQIEAARKLFIRYPHHIHDILIKPTLKPTTKRASYINVPDIINRIDELREFAVIGITEKELGDSLLDRMVNIARIRIALDNVAGDSSSAIHIFGSLDPLSSCLYFLAGAEIFDGLTWLRYAYRDGVAIYHSNYGALNLGVQDTGELTREQIRVENINYLTRLKYQLIDFARTEDFRHFEYNETLMRNSYNMLQSRLGGLP